MNYIAFRLTGLLVIALLGAASRHANGQATSGSLLGVVTDESGRLVVNAQVTIKNTATGLSRTISTRRDGNYLAPNLTPGWYSVTVEKAGFKTLHRVALELAVDQKLQVDGVLLLGEINETITVEGDATPLQTQSAETGQVMRSRQITDLPLLGRNFLELIALVPGVAAGAGGNTANYSVNGQREFANSILVNGFEVTGNRNNDTSLRPSVDSVEEFKAVTSTYSPEFGRAAGGVIAILTKSGTNALHGTVYDFLRSDATTARTFFSPGPSGLKQNNFGVSAGGPIIRNRTFWFAGYEGLRARDIFSYLDTTVPSQMIGYRPDGGVDLSKLIDPYTGTQIPIFDPASSLNYQVPVQFPGNVIPSARISPAGREILQNLFPAPNAPGIFNGWFSNFNVRQQYRFNSDIGDLRLDHSFSEKDRVSFSYDAVAFDSLTGDRFAGAIPLAGGGSTDSADASQSMNQVASISYAHVFDPNRLNELRLSYLRAAFNQRDLLYGANLADRFGIANANIAGFPQTSGFPQVQLGFGASTGGSTYKPLTFLDNNFQLGDSYSWVSGRHRLKFGYEYRHLAAHPDFSLFPAGYQYYSGAYSSLTSDPTFTFADYNAYYATGGNEIADLLLGLPSFAEQGLQLTQPTTTSYEHHFYLQDAWQLNRRLVLTYGIRYEYQAPYSESGGHAANFDPSTKTMLLAGRSANPASLILPDKNNFAPRLGIAWQFAPKMVARAGYGVFYTPENDARSDILTKNYPFFILQNFQNLPGAPISYTLDAGVARPTSVSLPPGDSKIDLTSINDAPSQSVYSVESKFRTGYSEMFSLMVQRELTPYFNIEAGYVGALGRKLPYAIGDLNRGGRISDQLGIIQGQFPSGSSSYHSFQWKADKRFSQGFSLLVSYTFSKSIDNGPAPFDLGRNHQQPQDPFNLAAEHALSSTDQTHNLVISGIWELPIARRTTGWLRSVLGGWQFNQIGGLHSGLPVNIVRNGSAIGYEGLRPNILRDPTLDSGQRTLAHYFDTAAFSVQGLGPHQPGNAGRNLLRGPSFINVDASLFKDVRLRETWTLQIRFEGFNIANTPHFANPNSDMSQGQFGSITQTIGNPRILQFGAKLKF